jgi:DNA-binding transcriptional MocR family regulator
MPERSDRYSSSVSKTKWSPEVISIGFTLIPSILLRAQGRLGLSPELLNVLLQLIVHWWYDEHLPYPSKRLISERMGKSPRSVQRYLSELENRGYIRRISNFGENGARSSNHYSLEGLVKELRRLAPAFEKAKQEVRNAEKPRHRLRREE